MPKWICHKMHSRGPMPRTTGRSPPTPRSTHTRREVRCDVSAVLLNRNSKVRNDDDLVFYNRPSHDSVVGGDTITADMGSLAEDVAAIAVIVSIGLEV